MDQEDKRQVLISEKEDFENHTHYNVFEVSAKTGGNIDQSFKQIIETLIGKK